MAGIKLKNVVFYKTILSKPNTFYTCLPLILDLLCSWIHDYSPHKHIEEVKRPRPLVMISLLVLTLVMMWGWALGVRGVVENHGVGRFTVCARGDVTNCRGY
jgi:hypothetical protein